MIPDGVYLNLHPDIYRDDPALGSTDTKEILGNVVQWHGKRRNRAICEALGLGEERDPEKARKVAAGKVFGDAVHTMFLDGQDAFEAKYVDDPDEPDLPRSKEEIARALRDVGVEPPPTSARREFFVAKAMAVGLTIADDWEDERAVLLAGRQPISKQWRKVITFAHAILQRHSAKRYLKGGRAEVSVFWTDPTGLRLKARFDYLHPVPVVDLKTFAMREGVDPVTNFFDAATKLAYDMQAVIYMEAREAILPGLVAEGRVYSGTLDADGVWEFAAAEDFAFMMDVAARSPEWVWLTVMTGGVPEIDTIRFPKSLMQFTAAQTQVEEARQIYREFREKFGDSDDELWIDDRGLVTPTDFNFSQRAAARGAKTWERG